MTQRIRNGHLDFALLRGLGRGLVLIGHDNCRIIVLSRGRQSKDAQASGRGNNISFHNILSCNKLFLPHLSKALKAHLHIIRNIVRVGYRTVTVTHALESSFGLTQISLLRK